MNKSILLVEDDPDDQVLTIRSLRKSRGVKEVLVANNGVEALSILASMEEGCLPVLVLLDLKLPKMDGLEVLRQIRASERTRFLPVVIMTSSREERDLSACYANGANSFVQKPVDYDAFTEAVHQLGTYWFEVNCEPPCR
ncbi:MAG: response regulator [Acidobacteria bacterium]|nr:response regulator [Acidobacteriota bacterium]MCB9398844.1 response regulator [Acidobacteriota bacterium]